MACFQILSGSAVDQVIEEAAGRNLPLAITVRHQNRWMTYRSWLVARYKRFMWLDYPMLDGKPARHDFAGGEKLSVTFRISHCRYVFAVEIVGSEPYILDDGTKSVALKVACPETVQRLERRLERRVHLPSELIGRCTFWLGGRDAAVQEGSVERPVWSGKIINLSIGGLYVRVNQEAAKYVEVGDLMGVRLTFGDRYREILLDARFRHAEPDADMALLGFQFVDPEGSAEAEAALEAVRQIVEQCSAEGEQEGKRSLEGARK